MPEDYKGLKFRIQSSKVLEAQFRALGAIPQVMAFSEVYQALQTGVVDGQENTPSNMFTQKFHEVQKYTTLTNHGYIGYVVVVNKKFWDGLPADVRGQLEKAMAEATVYSNEISEKENAEVVGRHQEVGQDRAHHSDRSGKRRHAQGHGAAISGNGEPRRQTADRRRGEGDVRRHQLTIIAGPGLFAGVRLLPGVGIPKRQST